MQGFMCAGIKTFSHYDSSAVDMMQKVEETWTVKTEY